MPYNPLHPGGPGDYPVKVGSTLLTLVDPHPGFEKAAILGSTREALASLGEPEQAFVFPEGEHFDPPRSLLGRARNGAVNQ